MLRDCRGAAEKMKSEISLVFIKSIEAGERLDAKGIVPDIDDSLKQASSIMDNSLVPLMT